MTANEKTAETLARLIRRTDSMGLDRADCTSDLSLVRSDALLALRLLGYGWNHIEEKPVALTK